MAKVESIKNQSGEHAGWLIWSPGDNSHIMFDERWTFNGDFEKPTFTPSMLVNAHIPGAVRSHFFVTDGKIRYLSDCDHELAGKTIDMVDVD